MRLTPRWSQRRGRLAFVGKICDVRSSRSGVAQLWIVRPHYTHITMNTLIQFFQKPVVLALFVLVGCLYILNSVSMRFESAMKHDRDDMVAALHQSQTSEAQIAAISQAFDRITSNVDSMAISFFAFTSVVLVCAFAVRRNEPSRKDTQQQPQGELRHDHVA